MSDQLYDQSPQDSLFELKLNAAGKVHVQKFISIVRISVLLGILVTLISLVGAMIRLIMIQDGLSREKGFFGLLNLVYPYFAIAHSVIFLLVLYYYRQSGIYLKKGIEYSNEETFNLAFQALYQSTIFSTINFSLTLLVDTPYLVWLIKNYL